MYASGYICQQSRKPYLVEKMNSCRYSILSRRNSKPVQEGEFCEMYFRFLLFTSHSLFTKFTIMHSVLFRCFVLICSCLYISGVPGTGKTATVHEVVRSLNESREEGIVSDFKFVDINGMRLTTPYQAYSAIWQVTLVIQHDVECYFAESAFSSGGYYPRCPCEVESASWDEPISTNCSTYVHVCNVATFKVLMSDSVNLYDNVQASSENIE